MLMHADRRAVDHLDVAFISLRYPIQNPLPNACLAPPVEAIDASGRIEEPIFSALRFMLGVAVGGGLGFDASAAPWFFLACGSGGVDAFEI
jgi:hypothetical protein